MRMFEHNSLLSVLGGGWAGGRGGSKCWISTTVQLLASIRHLFAQAQKGCRKADSGSGCRSGHTQVTMLSRSP